MYFEGEKIGDGNGKTKKASEQAAAAAAPKEKLTCPWCGATTIPDANGCCEYCGGSFND